MKRISFTVDETRLFDILHGKDYDAQQGLMTMLGNRIASLCMSDREPLFTDRVAFDAVYGITDIEVAKVEQKNDDSK